MGGTSRYPPKCGIAPRTAHEEYLDSLSHDLLSQHPADYETFSRTVQAAGKLLHMSESTQPPMVVFPVSPIPLAPSTFYQWTTDSVYYPALIVAELFGKSGKSQVIDHNANGGENLTPGYAAYEDGTPTRVLLINYIDDATGAYRAMARIAIGGGTTGQPAGNPPSVRVKYFSAPSVSFKDDMTWAGQTLGNHFESDGRLQGTEDVQTIQCDAASNTCTIPLKTPSLALVFLTDAAFQNSQPDSGATMSFETKVRTKVRHTVTNRPGCPRDEQRPRR